MVWFDKLKKLWHSFTGRMAAGVFLIHLLLVPMLFIGFISIFEHAFQVKFVDNVRSYTSLYTSLIKQDFKNDDYETEIILHLDEALLSGGIVFADFIDQEGKTIRPTIEFLETNLIFLEDFFFGQNDDDIYYIAIPISDDLHGRQLGTLRLGYDEQPTIELIHSAYYRGAILSVAYMLFSLLLVLFFGKRLSTPISKLRDMARTIAAGNHSVDIQANTEIFEIKHLANDLDHMRLSILKQHQEVIDREVRLQTILDNVVEGIIVLTEDGVICSFNRAAETIFNIRVDDAIGKNIRVLVSTSNEELLRTSLATDHENRINIWNGVEGKRQDGSKFMMDLAISKIFLNNGVFFTALVRDVTDRHKAEIELKKLSRAVESSSSAVIITDINDRIEYINPKFTDVTGYTKEDVLGKSPRLLQSDENKEFIYEEMLRDLKLRGEWKGEMQCQKKDGSVYWNRASISGVRNAQNNFTHFISINDDISLEYALSEELNYQARHDALTGLINRREFERLTEHLLSADKLNKTEHVLCFMDLDRFKVVNDTCGHAAGDELLRQISKLLQSVVRESDILARLGGDEFAVLIKGCRLADSQRVANVILEAIQNLSFRWDERTFRVGVSIGMTCIDKDVDLTLTEVLKQADSACYMAKEAGRNRIHIYQHTDLTLAKRQGEMLWVEQIHQGLEENHFCLYAQLIMPLGRQMGRHYELLIRKKDDDGNLILPGAFLPAAERYNLMPKLDRWVVEHAIKLLTAHTIFVKQIDSVSINLSGQSLADEGFLDFVINKLQSSGIEGKKFCFEVTETATIANLDNATRFIAALQKLNCQFALDDFGSGLSSFGYLKKLSVDYLKIDGMFVKDIVNDPIDHAMVKSINEIGHVMGIQTIAEFVENDEIKDTLQKIGVDYVQGYGIGRPMSLDKLIDQLTTQTD